MATDSEKIKRLKKATGYQEIVIRDTDDKNVIMINDKKVIVQEIKTVKVKSLTHDFARIVVDERQSYNALKGYITYKMADNPIGLLAGCEKETIYQTIESECVILMVLLKNNKKLTFTSGIFLSNDRELLNCMEKTQEMCNEIMDKVQKINQLVTFEYLTLSFSSKKEVLEIVREKNQFHIKLQVPGAKKKKVDLVVDDSVSYIIEQYHVYDWDEQYHGDEGNDISWNLEYKEYKKQAKKISGCNAYPNDWVQFLKKVRKIHPKVNKFIIYALDDGDGKADEFLRVTGIGIKKIAKFILIFIICYYVLQFVIGVFDFFEGIIRFFS